MAFTMKLENVKLQIMYFLDCLSFAMTVSTIPPLILSIGGDHLVLGIFGSGSVLCQLLAVPFLRTACDLYGKKSILLFSSISTFILSLHLIVTRSPWPIVINRWIFALFNHTQTLQKALVIDKPNKELINSFIQTSAFILGPVTSGYFFEKRGGITCIFFLASVLLLINIFNTLTVKSEAAKEEKASFAFMDTVARKMQNILINSEDAFRRCNPKQNWDLLVIKSLMIANATVLFTKFTMLLKYNYSARSFMVGCTAGYQAVLMHGASAFVPVVKRHLFISSPNIYKVLLWTVVFLTTLVGVCFGPTHDFYLVVFVPMILSRSMVDSIWLDLAVMRKDPYLIAATDTVVSLTRLIVPVVVGALGVIFGPIAIQLSIVVPVIVILCVVCSHRTNYDIIRRISVGALDVKRQSLANLKKKGVITDSSDSKED